ncbi:MAG TPA: ClcB-like voltage-gated chloride channel protein [Chthoniobacterales bacterium]|jgi:CIC family chloride channel protein|nr:ClcB-like voltage-gated chloride channel protein [Chthoniobacterales bacterium]
MENTGESPPQRHPSDLLRQFLKLKLWVVDRFRIGERQFMLVWAALIGFLGALAAEVFRRATDILHHLATGSDSEIISSFARLPFWQRVAVPTAGGLLAGLTLWIGNRLTSRLRQKTTTDYMEAIVVGSGSISVPASIVKSLSALFSISTGASIGREGPLVQLSSLVASQVAQLRKLPVAQRRQLVACGAAAGIASAYNAPIAGSFFVAEIILGTVVVEALGPLILAAVVATFTAQLLHGGGPIYKSPGFMLQTPLELIPLSCLGVLSGFLAPIYLWFLRTVQRLFSKVTLPVPAKIALGGAIVGVLAIISPDVCGNGQGLLSILFHGNWYSDEVLAILLLKLVATAATFGSGAVGGVFTPTLFVGAAIGMLYGRGILYAFPILHPNPAMYAVVGMGSFIAATTGAPLMSILLGFELTLDYTIAPLLMVNCVVAYYCSSIFEKQFIYGESLERKGAAFFNRQLAAAKIVDLIRRDPITLPPNAIFAEIEKSFLQNRYQHIYIVGKEMAFLGAVSLHDIKEFLDQPELGNMVIAADIMKEDFPRISPQQPMADALEKFSEVDAERLPVVDSLDSQRLIGSISKTDIMLHLAGKVRTTKAR